MAAFDMSATAAFESPLSPPILEHNPNDSLFESNSLLPMLPPPLLPMEEESETKPTKPRKRGRKSKDGNGNEKNEKVKKMKIKKQINRRAKATLSCVPKKLRDIDCNMIDCIISTFNRFLPCLVRFQYHREYFYGIIKALRHSGKDWLICVQAHDPLDETQSKTVQSGNLSGEWMPIRQGPQESWPLRIFSISAFTMTGFFLLDKDGNNKTHYKRAWDNSTSIQMQLIYNDDRSWVPMNEIFPKSVRGKTVAGPAAKRRPTTWNDIEAWKRMCEGHPAKPMEGHEILPPDVRVEITGRSTLLGRNFGSELPTISMPTKVDGRRRKAADIQVVERSNRRRRVANDAQQQQLDEPSPMSVSQFGNGPLMQMPMMTMPMPMGQLMPIGQPILMPTGQPPIQPLQQIHSPFQQIHSLQPLKPIQVETIHDMPLSFDPILNQSDLFSQDVNFLSSGAAAEADNFWN